MSTEQGGGSDRARGLAVLGLMTGVVVPDPMKTRLGQPEQRTSDDGGVLPWVGSAPAAPELPGARTLKPGPVPGALEHGPAARSDEGGVRGGGQVHEPDPVQESDGSTPANRTAQLLARFGRRLLASPAVQFSLLAGLGVGVITVWSLLDRGGREDAPRSSVMSAAPDPRPFPRLEVKGADPVSPEQVEQLLQSRRPSGAEDAGAGRGANGAGGRGTVVLRPGQLISDEGDVVTEPTRAHRAHAGGAGVSGRAQRSSGEEAAESTGRFFAPGGFLTGIPSRKHEGAAETVDLRVGDRFKAKLEVGVVSSVNEDVLARVTEDFLREGRVILRSGDMLRGRAGHDDKRMFIRFRSAEVGGRSLPIAAYAVEGQLPGLRARRREATLEERSRARVAGSVIAGAAEEAGAALAGASAVGRIAERVATGAAAEAQGTVEPDRSWVLEVSAGRTFEVVVTEAAKS